MADLVVSVIGGTVEPLNESCYDRHQSFLLQEHIGMRANVTLPFALLAFLIASESRAGACPEAIDLAQSQIDARIETIAAAGPSAPESRAATTHRQPTPDSLV